MNVTREEEPLSFLVICFGLLFPILIPVLIIIFTKLKSKKAPLSNPFAHARDIRIMHEFEKKKKWNEERWGQQQIEQKRRRQYKKYQKLIIKVLDQLREAVYPNAEVRELCGGDGNNYKMQWVITRLISSSSFFAVPGERLSERVQYAVVNLILDSNNTPICFECSGDNKGVGGGYSDSPYHKEFAFNERTLGLSRDELVELLQKQHGLPSAFAS